MSSNAERDYLASHDAHDYPALMARWSRIADSAGLECVKLGESGAYPVFGYRSAVPCDQEHGIYLSAGVHGDEPAGVWGLLEWAEARGDELADMPLVILPCFNPWGMVENRRSDSRGRDLNRMFKDSAMPLFKGWRRFVGERRFRLALHLHEDYDARGIYIYELGRRGQDIGHAILARCESILPIDSRSEVDGSPFDRGVLVRKQAVEKVVDQRLEGGWPEAIYMHLNHARFALTFETPSEFSLWHRVRAQHRFIDAALDLVQK